MDTSEQIIKKTQHINRCEKSLALEKVKKRWADTRRKIEFGGLVIKAAMDGYNKSVILGALVHACALITHDENYQALFESMGDDLFMKTHAR